MVVMALISYSCILFAKSPLGSTYTHLIECIYTSVSSAMNFAFYMNIQGLQSPTWQMITSRVRKHFPMPVTLIQF